MIKNTKLSGAVTSLRGKPSPETVASAIADLAEVLDDLVQQVERLKTEVGVLQNATGVPGGTFRQVPQGGPPRPKTPPTQ